MCIIYICYLCGLNDIELIIALIKLQYESFKNFIIFNSLRRIKGTKFLLEILKKIKNYIHAGDKNLMYCKLISSSKTN